MNILVCTDGSSISAQSAGLISKLKIPKITQITVLGVSENKFDLAKLNASMDLIEQMLGHGYVVNRKIRSGDPMDEILSEALEISYDLVAVGGGGRQLGLLHPQLGSTTSQLARKLHTHFLVSRNVPEKISKILVCAGAEAVSSTTMNLGGAWISNTDAEVALLHVLPTKVAHEMHEPIIQTVPPETGTHAKSDSDSVLDQASQILHDAGVKSDITGHIRRGLVVEEVISELSDGGYELLVVGAHYQPGQDRWLGTLLDDITDQLLNLSSCSVLII